MTGGKTHRLRLTFAGACLICFAIAAIWIVSYRDYFHGGAYVSNHGWMVGASIVVGDKSDRAFLLLFGKWNMSDYGPVTSRLRLIRFDFGFSYIAYVHELWVDAYCPFWFIQLAAAGLVLAAWRPLRRRRQRKRKGLCLNCGYDLRASSDRCPECGEAAQFMQPQ